jgi:hypothetical protein
MNIDNQKFILMCTACVFRVVTWCPNPKRQPQAKSIMSLTDCDARLDGRYRRCTAGTSSVRGIVLLYLTQLLPHSIHYILIHANYLTGGLPITSGVVSNTF